MRAAVLHAPGDLRIDEVPEPAPGPGEVVLAIVAASTCGTDRKTYTRGHPALGPLPARIGHEFAGTVVAVGEGVERFAIGDRVYCANSAPCDRCFHCVRDELTLCEDLLLLFGGFAELLLVPPRIVARNLHHLPDDLPTEVAPLAEPLACAVRAVDVADVAAGETVVVVGGGALGLMLTAVVASRSAHPIVLDPHGDNRVRAERFGAGTTITATRSREDVARVRAASADRRGADQVFEAVGRPEAWELAVEMARAGGAVNLFGGCAPGTTFAVPTYRVHYEEVTLRGTFHHTPGHIGRALELLTALDVPWTELLGPPIGLDELEPALRDGAAAPKDLVVP